MERIMALKKSDWQEQRTIVYSIAIAWFLAEANFVRGAL